MNWTSHICTYYCQAFSDFAVHAIPLLAKEGITEDEIRRAMELGLSDTEKVLDVRPAPEVDLETWRKEIFTDPEVWTKDGTTGLRIDAQDALYHLATVPFLLFVRMEKEKRVCPP